MAAVTRRSYAGAAPACTLTNSITAGDTTAHYVLVLRFGF
jgi:hypothetical protein